MSKPPKPTVAQRLGEADPVLSMGQRAWDFISGQWPSVVAFFATGGGVTLLALITDWARALGPLGIGLIVLATAFLGPISLTIIQANIAKKNLRLSQKEAIDKWKEETDAINPLDNEFRKKRILLSTLFNPLDKKVSNKRFIDCELIGPANIAFATTKPGSIINGIHFKSCDIIVARSDAAMYNVNVIEDFQLIGGSLYNCTIVIHPDMVHRFTEMQASFSTLTGYPEIDSQPIVSTG